VFLAEFGAYIYIYIYEILNFRIKTPNFVYEVTFLQQQVSEILGITDDNFKQTLVQKISRIKVYNALTLRKLYVEMKF